MRKHVARFISIACLAALSITLLAHVIAASDSSVGGGFAYEADAGHGFYAMTPELAPGDHFSIDWEWVMEGFRPVFAGGDFYVVEGQANFPFDPMSHRVLFHGRDDDPGRCCSSDSTLEMRRDHGKDRLTLVWSLEYAEGWSPVGEETTPGLTPLMGGTDTMAQERELRYIREFVGAAAGNRFGLISELRISHAKALDRQPGFVAAEALLALGALAFLAVGLGRREPLAKDSGAAGLVALVERGRDHLRAQLRLQVLVGPLLFIAAIFGIEALDNGGFGFYDPTGFYEWWIVWSLVGLWLTAVAIWLVGLVRVMRSLRHFTKTQEPDLGA